MNCNTYHILSIVLLHLVLSVSCCLDKEQAKLSLPRGGAAWVYDVNGGQPAMWAPDISSFNQGNKDHPISVVYSYGGDMEYYPDSNPPYETYFAAANQQAATTYKQTQGVEHVICVVDGRMDGGEDWSPDLSKLTVQQVYQWADITAEVYCSFPQVAGIQVDLEPFAPPYQANTIEFLRRLSQNLRTKEMNCVNDMYPNGRSVSMFLMAKAATPQVFQALGPNGYVIISGYDLGPGGAGVPHSPQDYGDALVWQIQQVVKSAGNTGFFFGWDTGCGQHKRVHQLHQ